MKFKITILCLVLICLFTVSSVSATDYFQGNELFNDTNSMNNSARNNESVPDSIQILVLPIANEVNPNHSSNIFNSTPHVNHSSDKDEVWIDLGENPYESDLGIKLLELVKDKILNEAEGIYDILFNSTPHLNRSSDKDEVWIDLGENPYESDLGIKLLKRLWDKIPGKDTFKYYYDILNATPKVNPKLEDTAKFWWTHFDPAGEGSDEVILFAEWIKSHDISYEEAMNFVFLLIIDTAIITTIWVKFVLPNDVNLAQGLKEDRVESFMIEGTDAQGLRKDRVESFIIKGTGAQVLSTPKQLPRKLDKIAALARGACSPATRSLEFAPGIIVERQSHGRSFTPTAERVDWRLNAPVQHGRILQTHLPDDIPRRNLFAVFQVGRPN